MNDKPLLIKWRLVLAAVRDQRLSGAALRALPAVLDRMNDQLECWPGYGRIAEDTGIDRRTATRAIDRLVELGYLEKQSRGNRVSNLYRIGKLSAPPPIGSQTDRGIVTDSDIGSQTDRVSVAPPIGLSVGMPPEPNPLNLPIEPDPLNLPNAFTERFDRFWSAYPRKEGKAKALQIWKREKLDQIADKILADLHARLNDPGQWKGKDQKFIPHGSTYINQRRWEDQWQPSASLGRLDRDSEEDAERQNTESLRRMGINA